MFENVSVRCRRGEGRQRTRMGGVATAYTCRSQDTVFDRSEPLKDSDPTPEEIIHYYLDVARAEYAVYKDDKPRQFSHFGDYYDFDVALFPRSEPSQTKIRLMEAVLRQAVEVAEMNHIHLMILIEPSSLDLTQNLKPNFADLSKFAAYSPKNLIQPIEQIALKHHIPHLSLYDVFRENAARKLYFDDGHDDHWNNAGQDVAASATAEFIHRHFITKADASPSFRMATRQ
jgi:hypothetical protein